MSDKIKVVIKRTGEPIAVTEIVNDLDCLKEIVGGNIEMPHSPDLPKDVQLVCNVDGKYKNLQPNIYWGGSDVIYGNIIFLSHDEEGESISLTDEQIEKAKAFIEENEARDFQGDSEVFAKSNTRITTFEDFLNEIFDSYDDDFDDYGDEYDDGFEM